MARYIQHITLTTGETRRSSRDEIADVVIDVLRPILREAVESGARVPITPGPPHIALTASSGGLHLMATIGDVESNLKLITMAVATRSRGASGLWRRMHEGREGLATEPDVPALTPWCAVVLEPGILTRPDALGWAGDLERCLAWAWIEERKADGD